MYLKTGIYEMGPSLADQIRAAMTGVVLSVPRNNNAFAVGKVSRKRKNLLDQVMRGRLVELAAMWEDQKQKLYKLQCSDKKVFS
jgi:hypothetical protein